jgi:hypothetical protein
MGYKIAYETRLNGSEVILYHERIELNADPTAMNVYKEWLTDDESDARVFHSREEAEGVGSLFESKLKKPILITL